MAKTPRGTSVGVEDPYEFVERCDHLTDDGRCRYAAEHASHDEAFARDRREDDLRCPAADPEGEWEWRDCPHFRSREHDRACVRCGLEERRVAHSDERPLLEEHHLKYRTAEAESATNDGDAGGGPAPPGATDRGAGDRNESERRANSGSRERTEAPRTDENADEPGTGGRMELSHEITVYLCRWCHAKVHNSWARIDDDAAPEPEAIAAAEERRSRELAETGFESAAERFDVDDADGE